MKRCPRCAELLQRRRVHLIELDGCLSCGGVFLDLNELQTLAGDPDSLASLDALFKPGQVQGLGGSPTNECPKCRAALKAFEYKEFRGIQLDRCGACKGVFLHHGEAGQLAERVRSTPA